MTKTRFMSATALAFVLYGAPISAAEGEHQLRGNEISISDLPVPVMDTFRRESKGGKIEELRRVSRKDGKTFFEGEVVKRNTGVEIKVSEDGTVVHRGKSHDESMETEKSEGAGSESK